MSAAKGFYLQTRGKGGGQGQIFNLKINNVSLVVLLKRYL